jgi:hypothetical protein
MTITSTARLEPYRTSRRGSALFLHVLLNGRVGAMLAPDSADPGRLCTTVRPPDDARRHTRYVPGIREAWEGRAGGVCSRLRQRRSHVAVTARGAPKGYRTIVYSRRFHWPNEAIREGTDYSMTEHVDDLRALLRSLDAAPAHLVGHCQAGRHRQRNTYLRPCRSRTPVLSALDGVTTATGTGTSLPRSSSVRGCRRWMRTSYGIFRSRPC